VPWIITVAGPNGRVREAEKLVDGCLVGLLPFGQVDVVSFDRPVVDAILDVGDVVVGEPVKVHRAARHLGSEDEQVDVADQGLGLVRIILRPTLNGGDATHDGAYLGVAGHGLLHRRRCTGRGELIPGVAIQTLVQIVVAPLAAVDERLGRLPRCEDVEFGMAVQIDQSRKDHTARR
jgi:hypothetical protein